MKVNQLFKYAFWGISLLASLTFSSCSKTGEKTGDDLGKMEVVLTTSTAVEAVTKASTFELPAGLIPTESDFNLTITGITNPSFSKSYDNLLAYNAELPWLDIADYSFKVTSGDPQEEGIDKPCFEGEASPVTVHSRTSIVQPITATLANSIFSFEVTEWFKEYYSNASFVILPSNGGMYSFNETSKPLVFVQPGSTLRIKGTATKISNGARVKFPITNITGVTTARTLSTVVLDMEDASTMSVSVTFNETITDLPVNEVELNPQI